MTPARTRTASRTLWFLWVFVALALVAAACGEATTTDDDTTTDDTTGDTATDDTADDDADDGMDDADSGETVELTFASFLPQTSSQGQAITWFIEELESRTNGRAQVEMFWAESLIAGVDMAEALRDGRTDIGNVTYAYTPGAFPLKTIGEIPFLSTNVPAYLAANNAMYAGNEAFRNEWEGQGIKVLSFIGIPPPITGCPEPCDTMNWFQGKAVRTSGSMTRIMDVMGADPQAFAVAEVYENVQRGLIDAYSGLILDVLAPLSLHEVGGYIVDHGVGQYASSTLAMNLTAYENLPDDIRAVVDELAAEFPEYALGVNSDIEDTSCEQILDEGGTVAIWSASETQRLVETVGDGPRQDWIAKADAEGVDGEAMLEEYLGLLERFEAEYPTAQRGMERCVEIQESRS
jgi:TRAP-type transport system periplasmic protein